MTNAITVPPSIWMTGEPLPSCYHGTPLEMVQTMADEMKPGLTAQEAIDQLLVRLGEVRRVHIRIPPDKPPEERATLFVAALIVTGIAHPMATA